VPHLPLANIYSLHSVICLFISYVISQGWTTSQRRRATSLTTMIPQRATSYTLSHMNIIPSLPHSHTYLCSNIAYEHSHQARFHAMCKSHPDFQGEQLVQNIAIYTRINTVLRKSRMKPGKGPHAAREPRFN